MSDFLIDTKNLHFLNQPASYTDGGGNLREAPLQRQFKTVKEILARFDDGHGVLLADDVGLGKTTVGALVAWIVACQGMQVRIYAPSKVLARRWAEELQRHLPMLEEKIGAHSRLIHSGKGNRIQVTTHHVLKNKTPSASPGRCDLLIVDEAHRAKSENSQFNLALARLSNRVGRTLILTATPFSIRLAELEQLLQFVGASEMTAVRRYAEEMKRLYTLGSGHDVAAESERLVRAADAAIHELKPFVIRHGIDTLSLAERRHFGAVDTEPWNISTPPASNEDIELLLRMDRLLQLTSPKKNSRRNDPRFHVGWQHIRAELDRLHAQTADEGDPVVARHLSKAKKALSTRRATAHPKIVATIEAIRPVLEGNEKVLIFCHHHAVAAELLDALEHALPRQDLTLDRTDERVWRQAWNAVLKDTGDRLRKPIIDWLCSAGVRHQVAGWLGAPANTVEALKRQLTTTQARKKARGLPTIAESAQRFMEVLLDRQSTSTRSVLSNIERRTPAFNNRHARFPGLLDEGLRMMGAWEPDTTSTKLPRTLYTSKADMVIALFNSPFGPDVLVTTDHLSEGVDLHRWCRHLIHYELDPSPIRTIQRNGRIRRIDAWAALTHQRIRYAYPTFGGTRDEKAVEIMKQRIKAFDLLLGGVPPIDDTLDDREQSFADAVLRSAGEKLASLNRSLTTAKSKPRERGCQ